MSSHQNDPRQVKPFDSAAGNQSTSSGLPEQIAISTNPEETIGEEIRTSIIAHNAKLYIEPMKEAVIKFPNRQNLHGTFSPYATIKEVKKFVSRCLIERDSAFDLYTRNPKKILKDDDLLEDFNEPVVIYFKPERERDIYVNEDLFESTQRKSSTSYRHGRMKRCYMIISFIALLVLAFVVYLISSGIIFIIHLVFVAIFMSAFIFDEIYACIK